MSDRGTTLVLGRRAHPARAWMLAVSLSLAVGVAQGGPAEDALPKVAVGPAAGPGRSASDEAEADRMHALTRELRCVVCQNESLADSTAPLAQDLKREIRTRMAAGDSDAQIRDFLVHRYGDFITYDPPWNARTLPLWLGPLALLALGGYVLWRRTRAPKRTT